MRLNAGQMDADFEFEFLNDSNKSLVYVNVENKVTLRLFNLSGVPVEIEAGVPTVPPPLGGSVAILLDLSNLYATPAEQGGVMISSPDGKWTAQYFPANYLWSLTANEAITWNNGDGLTFNIEKLKPTKIVGTYFLSLGLFNVPANGMIPWDFPVGIVNSPDAEKKDLAQFAAIRMSPDSVKITRVAGQEVYNDLTLQFLNTRDQDLVQKDEDWGPYPPKFTIYFVYDSAPPGYYALAEKDNAATFTVGVIGIKDWVAPAMNDGPVWITFPIKDTNHAVLKAKAIEEFPVKKVFTQFAAGPTMVYLQYTNVPGYNDGVISCAIDKVYPPMEIKSFEPNKDDVQLGEVISLNWDVVNASLVQVSCLGDVPPHPDPLPRVQITKQQSIILTAFDMAEGKILAKKCDIKVHPNLSTQWIPCGTIMLWGGDPTYIPEGFAICDGNNRTPNLQSQFVVGAGGQDSPNTSGSSTHTHNLTGLKSSGNRTDVRGAHSHQLPGSWYFRSMSCGKWSSVDVRSSNINKTTSTDGDHSHSFDFDMGLQVTSANYGGLKPAYYTHYYIMKTWPA